MASNPWSKFFWQDWESDPALRICSLAAQGLWMRLLCIAAKSDPIGYVTVNGRPLESDALARLTGETPDTVEHLLSELEQNGVFSRDRKGRIYSRRMIRDHKKSQTAKKNGKKGGNPTLCKKRKNSASVNHVLKGEDKPHKPEAKSQKPEARRNITTSAAASRLSGGRESRAAAPPPGGVDFDDLEQRLRAASGLGNDPSPGLFDLSPVLQLIAEGVSLEGLILPKLRALAKRGTRFRSWAYVARIIRDDLAQASGGSGRGSAGLSWPEAEKYTRADWKRRLEYARKNGAWDFRVWGPPPGEAGCLIPSDMVRPDDGRGWKILTGEAA